MITFIKNKIKLINLKKIISNFNKSTILKFKSKMFSRGNLSTLISLISLASPTKDRISVVSQKLLGN